MGKKPKPQKVSFSFKLTEAGDMARGYLSRTSGLTFEVAPPSSPPPSVADIIDDNGISFFVDDAGSPLPFVDDLGRQTATS